MLLIPNAIFTEYAAHLNTKKIPAARISEYKKWLGYYPDFCDKYPLPTEKAERVRLFCEKLKEKKQSDEQRARAAQRFRSILKCRTVVFRSRQRKLRDRERANLRAPVALYMHRKPCRIALRLLTSALHRQTRARRKFQPPLNQATNRHKHPIISRRMRRDIRRMPLESLNTPMPVIRRGQLLRSGTRSSKAWPRRSRFDTTPARP